MKDNKKLKIKIIIFFINFLFLIYFLFDKILAFYTYIKIEKYLIIYNNNNLINHKYFNKNDKPKVSIICPVFNREKYLIRFINSIQNQIFNDIELIFVDDCSNDKSIQIIEKCKKNDKRIILIKNKKNKGTFISRNIGVLTSKGDYLILPDPDDIISRDIIYKCYNFVKRHNFEMIRFNIYRGKNRIFFNHIINKLESRSIYQPELSSYLFYGLKKLKQIDFNVCNKFVKRTAYIKALNFIKRYYLEIYMLVFEDGLMNFMLYRTVKSFYYIKKIGYYYIKNNDSITKRKKNKKVPKIQILNYIFIYLKIIFEFTKNSSHEKNMCNFVLQELFRQNKLIFNIEYLNNDYKFYYNIINIYLNSKFINIKNKNLLINLKNLIKKNENILL